MDQRWTVGEQGDRVGAVPWTYILECSDGSYYVGSTIHLEQRVSEHQHGLGATYTRKRLPLRLVWAGEFTRIDQAFAFEKKVQGWSRRKREALMAGRLEDLPFLSSRSWASKREPGE